MSRPIHSLDETNESDVRSTSKMGIEPDAFGSERSWKEPTDTNRAPQEKELSFGSVIAEQVLKTTQESKIGDIESALKEELFQSSFQKTSRQDDPTRQRSIGERENLPPKELTKDELLVLYAHNPKWWRLRLAIICLFWITVTLLIVAFIILVIFSKNCSPRPRLPFWMSKVGYWVNPFTFVDSDGDLIGDLQGKSAIIG